MPPTAAVIDQIAAAIASAISAAATAEAFEHPAGLLVRNEPRPALTDAEIADGPTVVVVVPREETQTRETRASWLHEYEISIGVQRADVNPRLNSGADVALLNRLLEQLGDLLKSAGPMAGAELIDYSGPLHDPDQLSENTFKTVKTATYRLEREDDE